MNKYLYVFLFGLFPVLAFAANDQTFDGANISVGGNTYVLNGNADQLTVNASDFAIVLSPGGSVTITSSDKKFLTNTLNRKTTCGSTSSSATLDWPSNETSAFEVTVTPSSTSCTTDEGGGTISSGGGGGGGGGGAPASVQKAAPVVATTPAVVRSQSQTSPVILFAKDLSSGVSGTDVTKLQELLAKDKDIYPEGIVSGYFGPKTFAAVKRFQKKYSIAQVGRVGPATRAKLNDLFGGSAPAVAAPAAPSAPAATPTPAETNAEKIKTLQNQLKALQDQLNALLKKK